jgi:hypothetical protein
MLQFLFSPTKQFLYDSGKLLAGGKIYVYLKDTQNLATLYDGETGEGKSNPIILDANGRASVKADDVNEYRLEIYTPYDTLVYTCNAFYAEGGEGGGTFIVRHDDTLSGNGTSQNPLSVVNIPLAVDETMTAYTDIIDGVSSLVLGVNGDWFNDTFGSALNDKVDWSSFSACCSSVKDELANKLDSSAFDLSNYYNKQETTYLLSNYYNKQEIDETVNVINELKQDKLTFDYNENSAISAINGSALAGQGSEGSCPWISGAKIIADTQTLTDNMLVQVLSSFTLSGNYNHCIAVKGGMYRFPNRWEIASGIAETNYFMPQSSMSSYLPISSFSSYTAYIQNNLNSNWDYTNSAYSLSINNFYNKLDASAFSAWSATYSGNSEVNNYITNNSSFIDDSVNVVQNNSGKWNEIEVYEQNSGTYLTAHQTIPSAKWENASDVVQTNSAQWAENDGDEEVNNVVRSFSANGTWLTGVDLTPYQEKSGMTAYQPVSSMTGYYPMTGNPSGFLTAHQVIPSAKWEEASDVVQTNSADWSNGGDSYTALTSYSSTWNDITVYQSHSGDYITAHQIIPSSKWEDASDTVQTHSATWEENTGDTAVNLYVYNNSAINNEVNNVVTSNSADWNTVTDKLDYSAFTAYTAEDNTYLLVGGYNIGISSDDNEKTTTISYTGANGDTAVNNVVHSNSGLWNAVYDLVATYSAKWLINGDV